MRDKFGRFTEEIKTARQLAHEAQDLNLKIMYIYASANYSDGRLRRLSRKACNRANRRLLAWEKLLD